MDDQMRARSGSMREKGSVPSQITVPVRFGQQHCAQKLELNIQASISPLLAPSGLWTAGTLGAW